MSTSHIVSLLIEERDRLNSAISALGGEALSAPKKRPGRPPAKKSADVYDDPTMPDWVKPKAPATKKRTISAVARKRMAEGQRKRWAALNAAKDNAKAPRKTNSVKIAEAIAPTSGETDFKSKMSIAMAKSWAKRRAAAKKKVGK